MTRGRRRKLFLPQEKMEAQHTRSTEPSVRCPRGRAALQSACSLSYTLSHPHVLRSPIAQSTSHSCLPQALVASVWAAWFSCPAYHKSINQLIVMSALLHQGHHLAPEGLHFAGQHLVARPNALKLLFLLLQLCLEGVPLTG